MLTVEGPDHLLAERSAAIEVLCQSFRLIDPDADPEQLADRVLAGHVGGRVDGSTYTNERFAVRIAGPEGWVCRLGVGQYAFDVSWDCPQRRGDTGWAAPERGAFRARRSLELEGPASEAILLRLALFDDLLIVLEGEVHSRAAVPVLRAAMDTLQRPE